MIYIPIGPEPERRGQTEDDKRTWDSFTLNHRDLDADLTQVWNDETNPPPVIHHPSQERDEDRQHRTAWVCFAVAVVLLLAGIAWRATT